MHTPFAPMGQQTVRFAKQYEGERRRAAGRRRHGGGRGRRLTWAASLRPGREHPSGPDRASAAPHTALPLGGVGLEVRATSPAS